MPPSTVAFPSAATRADAHASAAVSVYHNTALEVCDLVYGPATPAWAAVERFYEPSAAYENPLVSAGSRRAIADIHAVSGALAQLDVPRPAALLQTLLGLAPDGAAASPSWFEALRMSHEVTEICESETFDGHIRVMVEHTLHISLLPALAGSDAPAPPLPSTISDLSVSLAHAYRGADLRAALGQLRPALLRLRLPIITKLAFNDAGKITHHRDFWDVKDVLNLIPGMTLAQWVATRVLAHSVRGALAAGRLLLGPRESRGDAGGRRMSDEERGFSPAASYAAAVKKGAS